MSEKLNLFAHQRLIFNSDLTCQEKLLTLALALHQGEKRAGWPAIKLLASECSLSERSISDYLKSLTAKGIITSVRRRNRSSERSINWAALELQQAALPKTPLNRNEPHTEVAVGCESGIAAGCLQKAQENNNRKHNADASAFSQEKRRNKRWHPHLDSEEFGKLESGQKRYEEAVECGVVKGSESSRLEFLTLWENIRRRHRAGKIPNPGAVFMKCLITREWHATQGDEEIARKFAKRQSLPVKLEPANTEPEPIGDILSSLMAKRA